MVYVFTSQQTCYYCAVHSSCTKNTMLDLEEYHENVKSLARGLVMGMYFMLCLVSVFRTLNELGCTPFQITFSILVKLIDIVYYLELA